VAVLQPQLHLQLVVQLPLLMLQQQQIKQRMMANHLKAWEQQLPELPHPAMPGLKSQRGPQHQRPSSPKAGVALVPPPRRLRPLVTRVLLLLLLRLEEELRVLQQQPQLLEAGQGRQEPLLLLLGEVRVAPLQRQELPQLQLQLHQLPSKARAD